MSGGSEMKCPVCNGHITEIQLYKAGVTFRVTEDDKVEYHTSSPFRYHVRLFCSEGHPAYSPDGKIEDEPEMKVWFHDLPEEIRNKIVRRA